MRRNHENTNGIVGANHYQLKDIQNRMSKQESEIAEIRQIVKKEAFQKDMEAPDIGFFFPVSTPEQLELFMDRSHPEWNARRKEFYNLLFTCLSDQKTAFSKGLIHTLFTREYISEYKWPSSG